MGLFGGVAQPSLPCRSIMPPLPRRLLSDVSPQVQPITVVKNEYKLQVLHQIAVNSIYICYGLKQGSIRALNKHTAARVLIKAHTSMVTDMRFFGATSNLLASCDQAGDVVITKVSEEEALAARV